MIKEGYYSIIKNQNELDIYFTKVNMSYICEVMRLLLDDENAIIKHYENIDDAEFSKFSKKSIINLTEKSCYANRCITINDKQFGTKYLFVKSVKSFDLLEDSASILYNILLRLLREQYNEIPKIINYDSNNSYIDKYYDMTKLSIYSEFIETRKINELKEETEKAKKLIKKNKSILKGV